MTRVAIIGNAGGGKSTLSRILGCARNLPVYPIDHLQWQPGWVAVPLDDFARQHAALLAQERWIIDGWGMPDALLARFERADTIIPCGYIIGGRSSARLSAFSVPVPMVHPAAPCCR